MDIRTWLKKATIALCSTASPKFEAEVLLSFVTGKSRAWIMAFDDNRLTKEQIAQLERLLSRRVGGEPMAYLIGEREFWSMSLQVSPITLIPRPETELLVEQALAHLNDEKATILDLGTGSGAVALAVAREQPNCSIIGIDLLEDAVSLAKQNAARLNIRNVTFLQSDWFEALEQANQYDLILSNPPYIDPSDPHLHQGDLRFEPRSALVAREEGLADIRYIIEHAWAYLRPEGWLLLEHGWNQSEITRCFFREQKFDAIKTYQDYAGQDRVTVGKRGRDKKP